MLLVLVCGRQCVVLAALSLLTLSAGWSLLFLKSHVPISYPHRVVQGMVQDQK